MSASPTRTIAEYASATSASHLPEHVKERTKQIIFDEMACSHFGRRSLAGTLSARYAAGFAGAQEASILGTELRVLAPYAALANGAAGHGEEVDGSHLAGGHPGASIVHAAVAVGERFRSQGADIINAVALGYDLGARVRQAAGGAYEARRRLHLHADFLFALGAALAAGRMLGLDATRICHALALTTFQSNGLYATYDEKRHVSKSLCEGQYAFAGVSGALMSAVGLEGHEDILGAPSGVVAAWGLAPDAREILTRGLGHDYAVFGANFKFQNAGHPIHASIEAVLALMRKHRLTAESISSIRVGMAEHALRIVDGRKMHNICLQDMIAANVARGGLKLVDEPFPAILADPGFIRVRPLITTEVDQDLQRDLPSGLGANVHITTSDGATVTFRVDNPKGHSLAGGASWPDLDQKWREVYGSQIDRALELTRNLEQLEDVEQLTRAFATIRPLEHAA